MSTKNDENEKYPPTISFHIINVLLHGIVTSLITISTSYIFDSDDIISQLIVGFLFGLHPVHAEVVSNITSRGELLMSIFFLVAFIVFAQTRTTASEQYKLHPLSSQRQKFITRVVGIYVIPWICMTFSLFSKEQGATTLISLVVWDFCKYHGNIVSLFNKLQGKNNQTTSDDEKTRTNNNNNQRKNKKMIARKQFNLLYEQ